MDKVLEKVLCKRRCAFGRQTDQKVLNFISFGMTTIQYSMTPKPLEWLKLKTLITSNVVGNMKQLEISDAVFGWKIRWCYQV